MKKITIVSYRIIWDIIYSLIAGTPCSSSYVAFIFSKPENYSLPTWNHTNPGLKLSSPALWIKCWDSMSSQSLQLHNTTRIFCSPRLYSMRIFVWANKGSGLFIKKPIVAQDIWLVAWIHLLFLWSEESVLVNFLFLKLLVISGAGKSILTGLFKTILHFACILLWICLSIVSHFVSALTSIPCPMG